MQICSTSFIMFYQGFFGFWIGNGTGWSLRDKNGGSRNKIWSTTIKVVKWIIGAKLYFEQ